MNQKIPATITTVVFDLGGVLFDIDYSLTQKAFIALGAKDFDKQYSQQVQSGVFDEFEKGLVTPVHFRSEVLKWLPQGTTNEQVDNAWNALLACLRVHIGRQRIGDTERAFGHGVAGSRRDHDRERRSGAPLEPRSLDRQSTRPAS